MGVYIESDQPAAKHSWYVGYSDPYVGLWPFCHHPVIPPDAAALWTSGPGDVIHFRAGGSPPGTGWDGSYVACDHSIPAGTQFAVNGAWDRNGFCEDSGSYPAQRSGTVWSRVVTLNNPATYRWYFRSVSTYLWFWRAYNASCFDELCSSLPFMLTTTTQPDTEVRFEFDEVTGKMRAVVLGPTAARSSTWGSLKAIYR
jgi:hypothetical protein